MSPELGSVATKLSAKDATTSIAKDYVQTKSILDPTERQKASVVIKGKQPIIATEFEETEYEIIEYEDSADLDEEFATEEESKEEDEEVPVKTTSRPTASTKDKGKCIQTSDTKGNVATDAFLLLFFSKKSESLMHTLYTREFISKRNMDLE